MPAPTNDLVERLTDTSQSGLDARVLVTLLELLAHGDPIEITTLAAESRIDADDVRARLAAAADTEYDGQGRIIGQGLTLRPTPVESDVDLHRILTKSASFGAGVI